MQKELLDILACPKCLSSLSCEVGESENGGIISGILECKNCGRKYPVERGIPRFVQRTNYASSFGFQWNRFRLEQIDSFNKTGLSEKRFLSETGWTQEWLRGKWVLDAGCGAGRFLDIASKNGSQAVGLDMSESIDAAASIFRNRKNVHLVQGSIYELPFRSGIFDGCYCIGVIQHTPEPRKAIGSLPRILKGHGVIAITIYEKKKFSKVYSKYLLRPLTKRLDKKILLFLIKALMPFLFPVTEVLFRLPILGRFFKFIIPVADYVDKPQLSFRQRYRWAILDTFDMLSPEYDQPQTQGEAERSLSAASIINIRRLGNPGLNLVGEKHR